MITHYDNEELIFDGISQNLGSIHWQNEDSTFRMDQLGVAKDSFQIFGTSMVNIFFFQTIEPTLQGGFSGITFGCINLVGQFVHSNSKGIANCIFTSDNFAWIYDGRHF